MRDKAIPNRLSSETVHRNVRYSPSWSFRWDNRGRVAGEVETSVSWLSDGVSRSYGSDIKSGTHEDSTYASEVETLSGSLQTPTWQKSPVSERAAEKLSCPTSDQSISRNISLEVKESTECPAASDLPPIKQSNSVPSSSSLSSSMLSSQTYLLPAGSTPSKWPHRSPGHQLSRHVSDNRIRGLKSPSSYTVSEERPSFVPPTWSNESTRGSHGGSSDGWSMHAFSELMVTSQKERWSFDSESLGDKITRSSSRISTSPSLDLQTCGVCSKLLTEKSSWSSQKIFANNELSVVAVLICGHVYHAECLENMTPEINKYDPACPVCTLGEKQTLKLSEKALKTEMDFKAKASKRSRNRVVDSNFDGDSVVFDNRKSNGLERKGPKMGSSSSMKSSLGKPFLRRHFSFGSKGTRSFSENQSTRKKGFFWTRSSKE
ncbi:uncharacterized protein LOC131156482 isoform X2 [Malania oleifera]|uniref:uncharacterized protein LOC131156482 isoform X2 n=1 Tax=Malania oleifera TaxID=397392 RepID=UPI0025AE8FDC|nr:uncharacterized protein LOC131156482 isoform X2 [Malania oleifera]